jgi:hypothetical protein
MTVVVNSFEKYQDAHRVTRLRVIQAKLSFLALLWDREKGVG